MTVTIAVTGKSGNGKTTFVKTLLEALRGANNDKTFLLIDNDSSSELSQAFRLDVHNTLYDVKTNKYDYKSRLPENMSRQEFIEWAMQDILVEVYENVDIISTGLASSKDCRCYIADKINEALKKLVSKYDYAIIDCEFDIEYLNHVLDYPLDAVLVIAKNNVQSVKTAAIAYHNSEKHTPSQLSLVINKNEGTIKEEVFEIVNEEGLDFIGTLPYDEKLDGGSIEIHSDKVLNRLKELLFRINLPQI